MGNSPHIVPIHTLDDDSLLNIFYLYRPFFLGEDESDKERLYGGDGLWDQGRWWYKLTHVCQRWRNLTLSAASYLRLSLVCTNRTPVANMLAHSPTLPLTVDYKGEAGITTEDEEGILLAFGQRHRLRHLRLFLPVRVLRKLIMAIDGEFPILEYLILEPQVVDSTALTLPETLQAPNLRHLMLRSFTCAIRSRLHPTAVDLVTLPNLRLFWFRGAIAYLEAVVHQVTTPRLEKLQIQVPEELPFSIPHLVQFINTTENLLRFDSAEIEFSSKRACVETYIRETDVYAFTIKVYCGHLDRQVSSAAQFSKAFSQVLSAVEHLGFKHQVHSESFEEHNNVDQLEWRNLLRSFSNVKTLRIKHGLVEKLSGCLRLEDGEDAFELLPELQKLTYFGSRNIGDTFSSFIDARQNAGRPVTLVHRN